MTPEKAPATVTLLVCPVCGRTDRVADLKPGAGRHFTEGGRCPGTPESVEYVRA